MTRSKSGSGPGPIPGGQLRRGTMGGDEANPKSQSNGRRDVIRDDGADAGDSLTQASRYGTTTYFPGTDAPNMAPKGDGSTVPDPAIINRGYTEIGGVNLPTVEKTVSANRLYGTTADDTTLQGTDDGTNPAPVIPHYGVGGQD